MPVKFPRDLVLEAYLGRWVEITALPIGQGLRQGEPVELVWGSNAEQGKVPPSTAEGVLNNTGGHWTPGNPMSDYFDYLQGRNVPTRWSLRISRDTFTRTIGTGSSWGFTDTVDGWTTFGNGFDTYAVGSGVGTMFINGTLAYGGAFIGSTYADCRVFARCSVLPFVNVIGAPVEPINLVQRYQASGTFAGEMYLLRVEIRTDQTVWISIHHSTLGPLTTPISLTALIGLAHAGSNQIAASFQMEGQTLRGKAWDSANPEPLDWQVTAHHERLTGGFAGVRSGVATGNTNAKPVQFDYDDWELRLVRHTGELVRLQPEWDESHRIKKARIKCADVTQRLGRTQRPALSSAPRRYLAATSPKVYWPLDDPSTATFGAPLVGAGKVLIFNTDLTQADHWGQGDMGPAVGKALKVAWHTDHNTTWIPFQILGSISNAVPANGWAFDFTATFGTKTRLRVDFEPTGASYVGYAVLNITPTSGASFIGFTPGPANTIFTTPASVWDGQPHHFRLTVSQTGPGVVHELFVDGVSVVFALAAAPAAVQTFTSFGMNSSSNTNSPFALANMAAWLEVAPYPNIVNTARAALGWIGETALARVIRLCGEEALPLDYWGDPAQTRAMGPQRPIPLLDQLQECADTDGAVLYAPRYTAGVAFRGRRSMTARPAVATLDYAAGHVAAPLAPSADDRPTANLIRAERIGGGFRIVEQTSGPMNTKDPGTDPEAAGKSPADALVNVESDASLGDVGGWVRALGTVPDVRFPRVTVNLAARELTLGADSTLPARSVLQLGVGDRMLVQNLQATDRYQDLDQIVRGGRETFSSIREHEVTLNTAPYEKYRAGVYGDAASRYDGAVTTLDAQLTAGTVGGRAVTTSAGPVWTAAAGAFPMDVVIGGERITLSGITGAGAAQTMTISARNVNGLPVAGGKTHPAGTRVYLYQPVYYC